MGKNKSIRLSRKYKTIEIKGKTTDKEMYASYKTQKPCMNKN